MTMNARSLLSAGLLALTAVATTACGAMNSPSLTPSTTTLMLGWERWFKLDWSVASEPDGGRRIRGYITNTSGQAAEPVRLLAQALDASGAVVGSGSHGFPKASADTSARTSRSRICLRRTTTASPCGTTPSCRPRDPHRGGRDELTADAVSAIGPRGLRRSSRASSLGRRRRPARRATA